MKTVSTQFDNVGKVEERAAASAASATTAAGQRRSPPSCAIGVGAKGASGANSTNTLEPRWLQPELTTPKTKVNNSLKLAETSKRESPT